MEPRMLRLVVERQADLEEVDEVDVEPAVREGALVEPAPDRQTRPAGPGARDHHR
jgi:hypothetical protein